MESRSNMADSRWTDPPSDDDEQKWTWDLLSPELMPDDQTRLIQVIVVMIAITILMCALCICLEWFCGSTTGSDATEPSRHAMHMPTTQPQYLVMPTQYENHYRVFEKCTTGACAANCYVRQDANYSSGYGSIQHLGRAPSAPPLYSQAQH